MSQFQFLEYLDTDDDDEPPMLRPPPDLECTDSEDEVETPPPLLPIPPRDYSPDGSDVEGPAGCAIPIIGDVIGDTAYSERFVLKVLMKFANLEVFKKVIKQKAFDVELATLWEMSAEKDVVHFLLEHDALDLFGFALPTLEGEGMRIAELVVGIIANMCCEKESATALMKNQTLFLTAMNYTKTNDTAAIIQTLRMISHCLYMTPEDERRAFMNMFEEFNYTEALCFILKNSSNKDLLITALENFNTLCEYLNIASLRKEFFKQFVTPEVLESVSTAFDEIMVKQTNLRKGVGIEKDNLERILAITLQIGLNLVWFDMDTPNIYAANRCSVVTMISQILSYYEHKIVNNKVFDTDLDHIFQSASLILTTINVAEISNPNKFFFPGYRIWKTLSPKNNKYGVALNEEDVDRTNQTLYQLSEFLCNYMAQCTPQDFADVMNVIQEDYKSIIEASKKPQLQEYIESRIAECTKESYLL